MMKLTIFTPTFNRAIKLKRVYESLMHQHYGAFEWLIVDDGSADNTEEVVKSFLTNSSTFSIRYFKQPNGGKHRAYNMALKLAEGDWFFCLDSDDWLSEHAVEDILEACDGLDSNHFIVAYKKDENGRLLSDKFPNIRTCTLWELSEKHHCHGEFSLIFPRSLAERYLFPTFKGENFITESVVYDRINTVADVVILPKVITICEYQEDGLSNNVNLIMKNNPAGYCLYFAQRIDLSQSLKSRIITAGKYHCFRLFAGAKKSAYTGPHRVLTALAAPLGLLFLVYYKLLRGF